MLPTGLGCGRLKVIHLLDQATLLHLLHLGHVAFVLQLLPHLLLQNPAPIRCSVGEPQSCLPYIILQAKLAASLASWQWRGGLSITAASLLWRRTCSVCHVPDTKLDQPHCNCKKVLTRRRRCLLCNVRVVREVGQGLVPALRHLLPTDVVPRPLPRLRLSF